MYLEFYHLNRAPFQICNDPESLWKGRNYTCSRDIVNYCLMNPGKTGLITGDTGTGKSYVVHALLKSLDRGILSAVISNTDFSIEDFYNQLTYAFQIPSQMGNRHKIKKFFHKRAAENSKTLLILDEVQLLSRELTTEILQLAEIQNTNPFGLSICLVGQTGNPTLEESAAIRYHLVPLSLDKTTQYLRHRLHVAGATREIFTRDAISAIYRCTKGYPGMINALCDLALYFGCNEQKVIIDETAIQQTIEKFHFTEKQKNRTLPNKKNKIQAKKKTPLSRKTSTADTADKIHNPEHLFFKFCIVTSLLLLLTGGGYVYYKTNPEFADGSSTRLSDTETPPFVNAIKEPSTPAAVPVHLDNNFDAVGYPSENLPEKNIVAVTATPTLPADSARQNNREKPAPGQIDSVEPRKQENKTDTVANDTPSIEIQTTGTTPVTPVHIKIPAPELKAKPQTGIIPVPRSDTVSNNGLKQKENIEKEKIQIKETAKAPPEKIPEKRISKTSFAHHNPVFAPNSSLSEQAKKHSPAPAKKFDHAKKTPPNTQPNPMDLIDWLLKKKNKQ